jgi:hypothetical protein
MMGWSATVRTWYGAPHTNRTFSVVQQYPCLVAPQQSRYLSGRFRFLMNRLNLNPNLYIYNLS